MTKAAHGFASMALVLIAGGFFWQSADTGKVPAQLQQSGNEPTCFSH